MIQKQRLKFKFFTVWVFLMLILSILGGFRSYSAMPFGDSWKGFLNFYLQILQGHQGAWWAQHNEHRIVLAKLLFWFDLKYLNGELWPLIVVNYLLAALSAIVFYGFVKRAAHIPENEKKTLALFIVACLFFWSQHENFNWEFQIQSFLAQLLPLTALYFLYKSWPNKPGHFLAACFCGVLAVGSMANGVFALPLMTVFALLTGQSVRRWIILSILSMTGIAAYFYHYLPPPGHTALLEVLQKEPLHYVEYVLVYLGNPFAYIVHINGLGTVVAGFVGFLFLINFSYLAIKRLLSKGPRNSLEMALLVFIGYVIITALVTASGRLNLGISQAFSSRYTTPVIMAWMAGSIVYAPQVFSLIKQKTHYAILFYLILLGMTAFQIKALALKGHQDDQVLFFEREVAGLALAIGVMDETQIGYVNGVETQETISIAQQAAIHKLSIFGEPPFVGLKNQLNSSVLLDNPSECDGRLEVLEVIPGDGHFLKVSGWLMLPKLSASSSLMTFLNPDHKIIGFALRGKPRPDLLDSLGKQALLSGYQGYIESSEIKNMTLFVKVEGFSCKMSPDTAAILRF